MAIQNILTIKRFSAGLCALLFAYASMSTAFADKKGMPNENSMAIISGWIADCGETAFTVTSDTKELSNVLLVFGGDTAESGTWEKFEIEDGNLSFTYTYADIESPRVVTAYVKAGSYKTAKNVDYGGNKLGYEFSCDELQGA